MASYCSTLDCLLWSGGDWVRSIGCYSVDLGTNPWRKFQGGIQSGEMKNNLNRICEKQLVEYQERL